MDSAYTAFLAQMICENCIFWNSVKPKDEKFGLPRGCRRRPIQRDIDKYREDCNYRCGEGRWRVEYKKLDGTWENSLADRGDVWSYLPNMRFPEQASPPA